MQGEQSNLLASSSSSISLVLAARVKGDRVLSTAGTGVGEGVPAGVGTLMAALVRLGVGAGVSSVSGHAAQVEHSPQPRQIWPRPKSVEKVSIVERHRRFGGDRWHGDKQGEICSGARRANVIEGCGISTE